MMCVISIYRIKKLEFHMHCAPTQGKRILQATKKKENMLKDEHENK